MNGIDVLRDPLLNQGTGFSKEQREQLGLVGLLPPRVQTLEEQERQIYAQYQGKGSNLEKRQLLIDVYETNRTLFYAVVIDHIAELMPIIYAPVVAEAVKQYDQLFLAPHDEVFLSIDEPDNNPEVIERSLRAGAQGRDIRLIVVTDSEGILGIGDWGVNGAELVLGKSMVYTAAAGVNPASILPIVLDVGTDNEQLLADPGYLGNRHPRVRGERYDRFIDDFVQAVRTLFPSALLHWEDFGRDNAQALLDRYHDVLPTFNDDVQGTGAVALAGILGALRQSGQRFEDQRFMIYGAGTAGVGIARQLYRELLRDGLSADEARSRFTLLDRQGLLFADTPDMTDGQREFARPAAERPAGFGARDIVSLREAVTLAHPGVLIGTSTQPGAFDRDVVETMAKFTPRPIILPISNPTELAEATAEHLVVWSNGQALVGTGAPSVDAHYDGVDYRFGQMNNALVYPALGFGAVAVGARAINDTMISVAAHALGDLAADGARGSAILPPMSQIRDFSLLVAEAVAQSAIEQGLASHPVDDVHAFMLQQRWTPQYPQSL